MHRTSFNCFFASLLLLLFAPALWAAAPDELIYPGAQKELEITEKARDVLIPLGSIKKEPSVRFSFKEYVATSGRLTDRLFRVPPRHSPAQVIEWLTARLRDAGVDIVYQCASFECGANALWASDYFQVAVLRGPDKYQRALVGVQIEEDFSRYFVVYVIERGNKKVYYQLRQVEATGARGEQQKLGLEKRALENQLKQSRRVVLEGFEYMSNGQVKTSPAADSWQWLRESLQRNPKMRIALVGHVIAGRGDTDEKIQHSRTMAESVREILTELEIGSGQIVGAYGVGNLVPEKSEQERWVEVVLVE